jgi:hypothetical protein
MSKIQLSITHNLPVNDAQTKVKTLLSSIRTQYSNSISDLEESWSGNTGKFKFKAMGFKVSGVIVFDNNSVNFTGDIPFAALPFKGKIEDAILSEANKILNQR